MQASLASHEEAVSEKNPQTLTRLKWPLNEFAFLEIFLTYGQSLGNVNYNNTI